MKPISQFGVHFSDDAGVRSHDLVVMETQTLPSRSTMISAFLGRDGQYDGVFYTGVRTTGIFCRPSCPARKPKPDHVEFFPNVRAAVVAGYRPCKRCRPLKPAGHPPPWLQPLLEELDRDPTRRWTDAELRLRGLQPERVRRWFQKHHGMTFHAFSRSLRLGAAIGRIKEGDSIPGAAYDAGYESLSGFNEALGRHVNGSASSVSEMRTVVTTRIPTPLGQMVAGATDDGLCLLEFADRRMLPTQLDRIRTRLKATILPGSNSIIEEVAEELEWYFDGQLKRFATPILMAGTPFQESVWSRLLEIPFGTTVSYLDLAKAIGRPTAARAVARANGDNRIAIIIPCHRVVGKDGKLTGYGGGLWRKKRLLDLESQALALTSSTGVPGLSAQR